MSRNHVNVKYIEYTTHNSHFMSEFSQFFLCEVLIDGDFNRDCLSSTLSSTTVNIGALLSDIPKDFAIGTFTQKGV